MSECEVCAGQEYNGFPNRETFMVDLFMSNDCDSYEAFNLVIVDGVRAYGAFLMGHPRMAAIGGMIVPIGFVADAMEGYVTGLVRDIVEDSEGASSACQEWVLDVGSLWRVDWCWLAGRWLVEPADVVSAVLSEYVVEGDDE